MQTYRCTYTQTDTQAHAQALTQTYRYTCTHADTHKHTDTQVHTERYNRHTDTDT